MLYIMLFYLNLIAAYKLIPNISNFNHIRLANKLNANIYNNEQNNEDINDEIILEIINQLKKYPEKESDIKEDTFEWYLKEEFYKLSKNKKIACNDFFNWKKSKGCWLTYEEFRDIYNSILDKKECNLIDFIKINRIIDENEY